jgi:hypothetical protein
MRKTKKTSETSWTRKTRKERKTGRQESLSKTRMKMHKTSETNLKIFPV